MKSREEQESPQPLFGREQAVVDGETNQLRSAREPEPAHEAGAVVLDRPHRDAQLVSDLGVGEAERKQLAHLHFPVREDAEPGIRGGGSSQESGHDLGGH